MTTVEKSKLSSLQSYEWNGLKVTLTIVESKITRARGRDRKTSRIRRWRARSTLGRS